MVQKSLTIRRDNYRFTKNHGLTLSSLVREGLDAAITEERVDEFPERDSPRRNIDAKRTTIKIAPRHQTAIDAHGINLSRVADALIDQYRTALYGQDIPGTQDKEVALG